MRIFIFYSYLNRILIFKDITFKIFFKMMSYEHIFCRDNRVQFDKPVKCYK